MDWFNRQKIGMKLIAGFLLVSFVGALIGLQGILKSAQMNDLATAMYEKEAIGILRIGEVESQFLAATQALRNALLVSSPVERELAVVDVREHLQRANVRLVEAKKTFVSQRGLLDAEMAQKALSDYGQVAEEVIRRLEMDDPVILPSIRGHGFKHSSGPRRSPG